MQKTNNCRQIIDLWPQNVPGARGDRPEDNPSLTAYFVDTAVPTPAVIVCPGGGYHLLAAHEGEPVAKWLNSLGITAFVLKYRIAPYRHPYPLLDAQRAIRLVRYQSKKWNINPNQIGILGFSAGGHLAATTGTHFDFAFGESTDPIDQVSGRPDLMVLCYPVISFGINRHQGSMINLLGDHPSEELRRFLSNEYHVTNQTPPTFLWHTADDPVVPVENSLSFASALAKHKIPFALHVFPNGPHGLGLAERNPSVAKWTEVCADWLRQMWSLQ